MLKKKQVEEGKSHIGLTKVMISQMLYQKRLMSVFVLKGLEKQQEMLSIETTDIKPVIIGIMRDMRKLD